MRMVREAHQAPVSTNTPGRRIGELGFIRFAASAKNSSEEERMRAPREAETRSVVVEANVASISPDEREPIRVVGEEGRINGIAADGENAWISIVGSMIT